MEDAPREKHAAANWAVKEVDHLFHRFARYTRFVLYSKWFLGGFALLLMSSLIIWPLISTDNSGMRISFTVDEGKNKVSVGTNPVMNNPVYEGTNENGDRFKITAQHATQKTADLVVIEKVEGQLLTQEQRWISLTADRADYTQAQNNLVLTGNVTLVHDAGYNFVTPQAVIDTKTMHVKSNQQISGEGPMGTLLATGFEISDNGNRITFGGTGRVTVHLEKSS